MAVKVNYAGLSFLAGLYMRNGTTKAHEQAAPGTAIHYLRHRRRGAADYSHGRGRWARRDNGLDSVKRRRNGQRGDRGRPMSAPVESTDDSVVMVGDVRGDSK